MAASKGPYLQNPPLVPTTAWRVQENHYLQWLRTRSCDVTQRSGALDQRKKNLRSQYRIWGEAGNWESDWLKSEDEVRPISWASNLYGNCCPKPSHTVYRGLQCRLFTQDNGELSPRAYGKHGDAEYSHVEIWGHYQNTIGERGSHEMQAVTTMKQASLKMGEPEAEMGEEGEMRGWGSTAHPNTGNKMVKAEEQEW